MVLYLLVKKGVGEDVRGECAAVDDVSRGEMGIMKHEKIRSAEGSASGAQLGIGAVQPGPAWFCTCAKYL